MTTLLRGGTIITGAGQRRADLLLDGEKIAWVGRGPQAADREVDVSGCFLFPGFIDAHTHFDLDVANTTTADDFCTGSRAALRGWTGTAAEQGRVPAPRPGPVASEGGRQDFLRLRLPHDHRRLERVHPGRAAGHVRPGHLFFQDVSHLSRHDDRRPGHLLGTEGAEAAGGHRRLPLRERRCH